MAKSTNNMFCVAYFFSAIAASSFITSATEKVTLLDTTGETSLDWTRYPYGPQSRTPGWVEESFTNFEQGINWRSYVVCDVAYNNVNNWLWTPFIERKDANRLYIEIKFSMRDCNLFPGMALSCKETFSLLYYEFDSAHKEPPPWEPESYKLIDRIAADEGRFTSNSEVIINTEVRSIPVTKKGVYFAFRDQGACLSLISIKIYHVVCPSVVSRFGLFPETPTGSELTAIVPASGQCVPNAVEVEQPRLLCKGDGNWTLPSGGCKCLPGYEPVGQSCKVCPPATFKPVTGDELCGPCPAHSRAPYRGSTECRCDHGYYRAEKDPKWSPCTQPPSAPQNVSFNFVDPTSVIITWSAPKFSGGRNDTRYRVDCDICGPTVSYAPSQDYLNETKVVVSGLLPLSSYRFQVYAENGASGHDSSQFSDITVKTQSAGYISLVISEDETTHKYKEPGLSQSFEKKNSGEEQAIGISGTNLRPGQSSASDPPPTAFVGSSGGGNSKKNSSKELGLIAGISLSLVALVIVIVLVVVIYLRSGNNECNKKQPSDCDTLEYTRADHPPLVPSARFDSPYISSKATPIFSHHYSTSPSYAVETHTYEDPNQILPLSAMNKHSTCLSYGTGSYNTSSHHPAHHLHNPHLPGHSCVSERVPCDFSVHDISYNINNTYNTASRATFGASKYNTGRKTEL